MLRDLHTMNLLARKKYPDLPLILLGHSMGSFLPAGLLPNTRMEWTH